MKPIVWLAGLGLCIVVAQAQAQAQVPVPVQVEAPMADIGTIQIKDISVSHIDTTHVELSVNLSLTPDRSGMLDDVELCSLHLNGLPVYAAPLNQEIALKKGDVTALPPVYISVFFHDLNTLHPLHEMIDKQSVHVQGELVSGVKVGLLGKLALHSEHPQIVVQLSQDVPVVVPGTTLERNLALGILSALDTQMSGDSAGGKLIDVLRPEWIRTLETQAQTSLLIVESSYSLTDGKTAYPVNVEALGFRVPSGKIATSAEMLSPWKYDTEFLGAIGSGTVKMVKKSQEIRLSALSGSAPPLLMTASDFAAEARGSAAKDRMTTVGKSTDQIQVLRRATPSTLAVLVPRTPATDGFANAPDSVLGQDQWDKVVVFRLRASGDGTARIVEPLQIGARREGDSIRLTQPVDEAVFGSPIIAPEGVIGLVQDARTGTFLPADLWATAAQAAKR